MGLGTGAVGTAAPARSASRRAVTVKLAVALAVAAVAVVRWHSVLTLLLVAAVLVPIEARWPSRPRSQLPRRREDTVTDTMFFLTNGFVKALLIGAILAAAGGTSRHAFPSPVRDAVAGQPVWLQTIEAVIALELGTYWAHRMAHRWSWWWRLHRVHHSSTGLTWLASSRDHPLDEALRLWLVVVLLDISGFSLEMLAILLGLYAMHGFVVHANVRVPLAGIDRLIVTPEYHHWHHSQDLAASNRNLAPRLPIVDRIFGTYHAPDGAWPVAYGVDEPVPADFVGQLAWPFERGAETPS